MRPFRSPHSPRRTLRSLPPALLLCAGFLLPSSLFAQVGRSIQWTETQRIEAPGGLGLMIRALPGISQESSSEHALYLSGGRLVSVDGSSTTLLDLEQGRWISVDHEDETYISMTFEESAAMAQEMASVLDSARSGAEDALREADRERNAALAESRRAMEQAQAQYRVRVNTEITGRTQRFDGLEARQYFLTSEVETTGAIEGMDATEAGTMYFLMELWQSDEFPDLEQLYAEWGRQAAADPAMQEMAEEVSSSLGSAAASWEAMALWNPGVAAGLEELFKAMDSMEGTTVRSITTLAFVPRGVSVNRSQLQEWEPETMGDQIRGQAGSVAQDVTREAARSALRGATRGLLGRGGNDAPAPQAAPAAVRPMLRITTSKSNVRMEQTTPSDAVFQVPEGYQQIDLSSLRGGGEG